jgi:hypothetical protein
MLTSPLTDLSIRYPPAVYVNISSHRFKHKISTEEMLTYTAGGYLMLKSVRGAVNINCWWISYA